MDSEYTYLTFSFLNITINISTHTLIQTSIHPCTYTKQYKMQWLLFVLGNVNQGVYKYGFNILYASGISFAIYSAYSHDLFHTFLVS